MDDRTPEPDAPRVSPAPTATDWRHARTERLWLDIARDADVDVLHAIHADPDTWRHFPSGRHTHRSEAAAMVRQSERQFVEHRLGYWSVRDAGGGPVVGRGGCAVPTGDAFWNLYYRLSPSVHGQGYAVEPDRPVRAFLLEHNVASRRTAERAGMRLVWRGPDRGNPDPAAVRLAYLDREPTVDVIATLDREFGTVGES